MIEFRNGKYEVIVNGKVVARTASKYYAKQKDAELSQGFVAESERMDEYPINDRFDYAYELTRLVASKKAPSAIITGVSAVKPEIHKSFTLAVISSSF